MTDTVDKITIQSSSSGVKETTADVQGLSKAMDGVTVASEKVERSTVSVENKFKSLERRFGTTAGQASQLEKIQKTVNAAVAQNPALQERANDILAAAGARYVQTTRATEALAKSTGLARHELINLSRQAQDVVVSLGSGQGLGTVLLQQGTQIADVFANSQGSVKGFFQQLGAGAASALTPMRLLAGGIIGVGAAALYIGNNWAEASRDIDRALIGIGRRTGETSASIGKFSSEASSAFGLSVAEARNAAIEFTKTGNISVSALKGVGEAVHGYSILTGKDAKEATKDLADALGGDLVKAALKVDQIYGVMDARTLEHIRTLEVAGRRQEAIQIIIDRTAPANQKAAESVGALSKAWAALGNVTSAVFNGAPASVNVDQFSGDFDAYARSVEEAQKANEKFKADQIQGELDRISSAAYASTQAILPQIEAINKLDEAIRYIQQAQANGNGPTGGGDALAVLQYQKALQQESLETTIRQAQVVVQLQQAWGGVSVNTAKALSSLHSQLQIAQALTGAAQMKAQYEATYNALLVQGVSQMEAQKIASEQFAISQAQATTSVLQQVEALKDQNTMLKARQSGTEASAAAAIAYKNAINSGADETSAAALKAETLKNHMLQASSAAGSFAGNMYNAMQSMIGSASVSVAGAIPMLTYDTGEPGDSDDNGGWTTSFNTDGRQYESMSPVLNSAFFAAQRLPTASSLINGALGGGVNAALSQLLNTSLTSGPVRGGFGATWEGLSGRSLGSQSDITGAVSQLFDLKLAMAGNNTAAKTGIMQEQLAWLQQQPMTIQNMRAIVDLTRSIRDLQDSTDALTDVQKATLNPLYTEGRSALKIGYYKAATGLSGVVQGPPGIDNVPVHMMLTAGEHVKVTPAGQSVSNDNSKIVNNTINIIGSQSTSRRSQRQAAQGFGQMMASVS